MPIQIAHLWGGESYSEGALGAFADAVAAHAPATKNLYFDVAEVALAVRDAATLERIAAQMRRIGLSRILYASDGPEFGNMPPKEAWEAFAKAMPLTPAEMATIAKNVAPYLSGTAPAPTAHRRP